MSKAANLVKRMVSINESFKKPINESATQWNKVDPDASWGDDAEDDVAEIGKVVKSELGIDLKSTFTVDSESEDNLEKVFQKADKTKVGDTSKATYQLYTFEIDGHKVVGSNWDGIVWVVSADKFDIK